MAWMRLCRLSDVAPEDMSTFTVDGIELLLVRGADRYLVIPPVCPHMSTPLSEGFFDGHTLTCSKHLWQFSIDDGGAPVETAEAPLLTYEVRETDGDVWVNLDRELKYSHQCEESD